MLSFTEFTEEFITGCNGALRTDPKAAIRVESGAVTKPQRGKLTGLRFIKEGSMIAPTLYAEDLYSRYTQGCPVDRITHEVIETIRHSFDVTLPFTEDFDLWSMADDINLRLLSKKRNPAIAESVPHMDVGGGLMLITDVVRGDFRAMITNDLLKDFDISKDELFDIAFGNIPENEAVMYVLSDMVYGDPGERRDLLSEAEDGPLPEDFEVFVLSNRDTYWGAATLFYPGVIDRLHEMIGNFYVIPSSVHEVLIMRVSADADPDKISEMIWSANRSVVDEEDVLSDDLLICDSDKLRVAVRGGSGCKCECEDGCEAD